MKLKFIFTLASVTFFLINSAFAQPPSSDYNLVFADEFNGSQLDPVAWYPGNDTDCHTHGSGSNEADMWYKPDNVTVENGNLTITAKYEPTICDGNSKLYTSGSVITNANFQYGYYEVRAKIPEGNGFWPAFWLWSGNNQSSYQEIDVFEFCGCDCSDYQAGFFYEDDGDHVVDDIKHTSKDIEVGNNGCNNFNIYGAEWTKKRIKFYRNGSLVADYPNTNVQNPMGILLNLAVGGAYSGCGWTYCGGLSWDTDGSCHVTCGTTFPATYEVDWVRVWQKDNQALYINGIEQLCVGETFNFKAPLYPNATYAWSATSGLQINPISWPSYDGGIWRQADVKALSPGLQTVTLTVTFPSGYEETETYDVMVLDAGPPAPNDIVFVPNDIDCCYNYYTPAIPGVTSYVWTTEAGTFSSTSNQPNDCITWGPTTISVEVENSCGSSSYTESTYLQRLDCWDDPMKIVVFPNPSSSVITLNILDAADHQIDNLNGQVLIKDNFSNTIFTAVIDRNLPEIDVSNFDNGVYQVFFIDGSSTLNASFIKNDGN